MWHIKLQKDFFGVHETYLNFKILKMKLVKVSHIEFKRNLRFMRYVKKSIYDVIQSKVFYESGYKSEIAQRLLVKVTQKEFYRNLWNGVWDSLKNHVIAKKGYKCVFTDQYAWKSESSYMVSWKRFVSNFKTKFVDQFVGFMEKSICSCIKIRIFYVVIYPKICTDRCKSPVFNFNKISSKV